MHYSSSPRAEYYAYHNLFPTRHATRFSRLQHETDETLATMFLRCTQPRPRLISAPPLQFPHWMTWCIDQVHQSGITPAYYTDGSYAEELTITTIFRPESLTRLASAIVIIKDTSADWTSQPITILRITNGSEVGSRSVYPMEFLALAASMWISEEGGHNTPTHTDAQSVLDTIAQSHRHFE